MNWKPIFLNGPRHYGQPVPLLMQAPQLPGVWRAFNNAEAAFQALKFWDQANDFEPLSGPAAFFKYRSMQGHADFEYAGFGSNWKAMASVLEVKFAPGTLMAELLDLTGDAFLLEHNEIPGRDCIWSDNQQGDGLNWLGLQLMLLREQPRKSRFWSAWLLRHCDRQTGDVDEVWRNSVQRAAARLKGATGVRSGR
ncbi:unnamed protein product [Symbiodinium sp. CCMP2592]|nr:unnamed protein product [Symbiodinium sp. CCMP2592]